MAASGDLTSALRLFTEAIFNNIDDSLCKGALLFLSVLTLFEFSCIFLYAFVFSKLPVIKHYHWKAALEGSKTVYIRSFCCRNSNRRDPKTRFLYENTGEHQLVGFKVSTSISSYI